MYVVMGELTCRKEDGEDDAEGVSKVIVYCALI